jgi:DNA polymerase-3 subunit chi
MSDAAPCEVWFYHLERSALDQVLPDLLEKTLARGWRASVRAQAGERLDQLDAWLWSWRDDAFLPHGLDSEPMAERQPVLLTTGMDNRNDAQALFLIDSSEAGDISPYERCIVLFDGRDAEALAFARRRWSRFKADGFPVSYWKQADRGWEKQA